MSRHTSLFLMELEHGKYYVGQSSDPVKAMEEHREGLGPAWTQIHRPLRLLHVLSGELDASVRTYMLQYGVENVRGGSWEHVRLTDSDRHVLCGALTKQRGCVVC